MLSPRPPESSRLLPLSSISPGSEGPSGITLNASYYIPRLVSGPPEDSSIRVPPQSNQPITPNKWSVFDVCQFLRLNDCSAHCDSFRKKVSPPGIRSSTWFHFTSSVQKIDGPGLLALSKEQIVNFIGMKMGPSLKVFDLIQTLKARASLSSPVSLSPKFKHSSALQAHLLSWRLLLGYCCQWSEATWRLNPFSHFYLII
jgi:hypothetical protein